MLFMRSAPSRVLFVVDTWRLSPGHCEPELGHEEYRCDYDVKKSRLETEAMVPGGGRQGQLAWFARADYQGWDDCIGKQRNFMVWRC
jgi:hypothetical protein